jgi:acyl dehydratase
MSELLEHLSKYIGTESEPIVYSIDKGAIKFFADSLMNPDPLYWEDEYARTTKHDGIIAPPTFYGGATSLRTKKLKEA